MGETALSEPAKEADTLMWKTQQTSGASALHIPA